MPILDDDVVKMCPSDFIGYDNRGTKESDWVIWSLENQYQTSTCGGTSVNKQTNV